MSPDTPLQFFAQWQFWLAIINITGLICLFLFNKFANDKVVGNNLHHIGTDIKSIIIKQDETDKKVGLLSEDISYLKGTFAMPLTIKRKTINKNKNVSQTKTK